MRDLMSTKTYIQVISIAALLVGGYFQTHRAGVDVEMVTAFPGVGWLRGVWVERDNRTGQLRTCKASTPVSDPPECSVWGYER